ncbi:MAG: hypothetical protein ACTHNW_10995 [Mucilaginibacter sp.]
MSWRATLSLANLGRKVYRKSKNDIVITSNDLDEACRITDIYIQNDWKTRTRCKAS